jgi:predicted cobalt transporter CbtA
MVHTSSTSTILLSVVLAGLLAGLATGLFHYVFTEPVIEQAIVQESMMHPEEANEPPVVTRDVQRVGGIVGWVLYGLFMGLIFGVVYALQRPRFGHVGLVLNGLLAAGAAYWLVGLAPFLKYPANPPGVGGPDTITYRQTLFVLFWVLSVGGALAAGWAHRLLGARLSPPRRWLAVGGIYALYVALLFALMPANPDPVTLPAGLVTQFRLLSLVGLTLFWLVLGAVFGLLLRALTRHRAADAPGWAPSR